MCATFATASIKAPSTRQPNSSPSGSKSKAKQSPPANSLGAAATVVHATPPPLDGSSHPDPNKKPGHRSSHPSSTPASEFSQSAPPIVHGVLPSPEQSLSAKNHATTEPRSSRNFADIRVQAPAFLQRTASSMIAGLGSGGYPPCRSLPSSERLLQIGLESSSQPLPVDLQHGYSAQLATDLSDVRVHTGGLAETAATLLGARAFALGNHLVFGPGRFAPAQTEGRRLLAHELAHVAQQRHGPEPAAPIAQGTEAEKPKLSRMPGLCASRLPDSLPSAPNSIRSAKPRLPVFGLKAPSTSSWRVCKKTSERPSNPAIPRTTRRHCSGKVSRSSRQSRRCTGRATPICHRRPSRQHLCSKVPTLQLPVLRPSRPHLPLRRICPRRQRQPPLPLPHHHLLWVRAAPPRKAATRSMPLVSADAWSMTPVLKASFAPHALTAHPFR